MEREISPGQNAKELSRTVLEMPSRISEAYSREVDKIIQLPSKEMTKALAILRWVLFAVRPLQVKELVEALIVSDDDDVDLDEYPFDDLPDTWTDGFVDEDYVNEMILSRCGSLLRLRSRFPDEPLSDQKVHFVHFSVKEYLTSLPRTDAVSKALNLADIGAEEIRLSKLCLRYLALSVFERTPSNIHSYPFLFYAAWAWYFHAFRGKPAPGKDVIDRTQRAFDPATSNWRIWTPVLETRLNSRVHEEEEIEEESTTSRYSCSIINDCMNDLLAETILSNCNRLTDVQRTVQNPLYYASLLGLKDVAKWLEGQGLDCSCEGGQFGFPLQAAVVGGYDKMVNHLLHHKVNVSQRGGQYGAAIIAAAAVSTTDIVQSLLDAGADLTANDEHGWNALHHASKTGNARIVEQLLNYGAKIDSKTSSGLTATSLACAFGNSDVLQVLLLRKANLQLADNGGATALHFAIGNYHTIACNLLDVGAPVNDPTQSGLSPLFLAVAHNLGKVVQKLLERDAEVNPVYLGGWTVLHQAVASADLETVRALLNAGANLTCSDDSEWTPLHIAIWANRPEIISQLLDHGADINQRMRGHSTLFLAVENFSLEALKLLLGRGLSTQGFDQNTSLTLLDHAILLKEQDMATAEELVKADYLQRKASSYTIYSQDMQEMNGPDYEIMRMALRGEIEGVGHFLKGNRSDISQDSLNEAFHIATAQGFGELALNILNRGMMVNRKDMNGRTPLHHATSHVSETIANALTEKGASLDIEDDLGSTPLDLAAVTGGQKMPGFITRHLRDFGRSIQRRPTLLELAGSPMSANTATDVRKLSRALGKAITLI